MSYLPYFFYLPHNIIFKIQFMTTIIITVFYEDFKKKFNCRIIKNEDFCMRNRMGVIYQFVFELNQARFFPALEVLVAINGSNGMFILMVLSGFFTNHSFHCRQWPIIAI